MSESDDCKFSQNYCRDIDYVFILDAKETVKDACDWLAWNRCEMSQGKLKVLICLMLAQHLACKIINVVDI